MRRPQASTIKDFLTRIPPVVRCSAYQRNTGVAMAANEKTFGGAISEARKAKGWALKDLASRVLREDEEAISPQYLNDIEHDRRSPSSDRMVQQFADALGIARDWLYYLAGRFPEDVRNKKLSEKQVAEAMVAFRGGPERARAVADGEIRSR